MSTFCEIGLRWVPQNPIDDETTMVEVMAWSDHAYHQTSNISCTLVGNKLADHSDVGGASPVGAAPTTSSFSTWDLASMNWTKTTARRDEKHLSLRIQSALY